jgi:hypothetical protein
MKQHRHRRAAAVCIREPERVTVRIILPRRGQILPAKNWRELFCRNRHCAGSGRPFHGIRIAHAWTVAKKFQAPENVRTAVNTAALNLRIATMQLAGLRIPPRVRTVPSLRRRLPVITISEPSQPVIIRHVRQNLGTPIAEPQLIQNQRV